VTDDKRLYTPLRGKMYSLFAESDDSERYLAKIEHLVDMFLDRCPDARRLLDLVQKAGENPILRGLKVTGDDRKTIQFVKETLRQSLSIYTRDVSCHLQNLSLAKRFDSTLSTKEELYHLYMLEIELVNRIHREEFKRSEYKFALIAHCLRDYRPQCRSVKGDVEAVCKGCTEDCFVRLGSVLLERYGIKPYISVEMDQEKLFGKLSGHSPCVALGRAPKSIAFLPLCPPNGHFSHALGRCDSANFQLSRWSITALT
jgi:hypothetical protein